MILRFSLLVLVNVLTGCASSQLRVAVDLYDEDPRFEAPLSPKEAVHMIEQVEQLRSAAKEKTTQRKYLATMSKDIFVDTWDQVRGDDDFTKDVEKRHTEYHSEADAKLQALNPSVDIALAELKDYVDFYADQYNTARTEFEACESYRLIDAETRKTLSPAKNCAILDESKRVPRLGEEWILRKLPVELRTREAKARASASLAVSTYEVFASPLAQSFAIDWTALRSRLYSGLELSQQSGRRDIELEFQRAIQSFNTRIAELAAQSKLISGQALSKTAANSGEQSPQGLLNSAMKIAIEIENLRSDLPESATAQTALAGLVRSSTQFLEQIDRLQDRGNPVWRIVTDPANEPHWNQRSVQTSFYAEGKSSVVMVRQDPMRFDVHEGTNHPAALIKGQLEISRAVANAALSITGTATGLRLPAEQETSTTDSEAAMASTNAATFARRKAGAEEAMRSRDRTLRGLELALANILANLAAGGDDPGILAAQKSRLESVLKAYRPQLDMPTK